LGKGIALLESNGVEVDSFDDDLAKEIRFHNADFLRYWEKKMVSENDTEHLQTPSLEENQPVQGASTEDFSKKAIRRYLRAMNLKYKVPSRNLWTHFVGAGFLKTRVKGKLIPTLAGLVLFGKKPDRFFPQCKIKADAFSGTPEDGTTLKNIVGNGQLDISGPLSEMVDAVQKFFNLHVASIPIVQGSIRRNVSEYPWEGAVREAIVNALVHRDYRTSAAVFFRMFRDRIEVRSPGLLPPPLTLNMLPNDVTSVPRNPRIADGAFRLGYMEARGFGIPTMPQVLKEWGLKQPEFRIDKGFFVVTFWGREATPILIRTTPEVLSKLESRQITLLELIESRGKITSEDWMQKADIVRSTAVSDLKKLMQLGLIEKRGKGPATHYTVKK
jgi:ATP-dependent DNA helicase RecG